MMSKTRQLTVSKYVKTIMMVLPIMVFVQSEVYCRQMATWSKTIVLRDYMKRFVFPEELISYEIDFPGTFPEEHLKLTKNGEVLEYQLENVTTGPQGNLLHARIYFRTGLDKGQEITFVLQEDPDFTADFTDRVRIDSIDTESHTAILYSNMQQVRIPYGTWYPDVPLAQVPAPVMEISHAPGEWVGPGKLTGDLAVSSIKTEMIENGNLFLKYKILYTLEGGKTYEVVLTVRHNEKYVTIDENIGNILPGDNLGFRFSYKKGVDPDARMAISNAGYRYSDSERWPWCGHYDKQTGEDGSLPYQLGQWSPHSATSTHATLFWNDAPENENAIIFSVYRIRDWKTHLRYVWSTGGADENLYFYAKGTEKYMQTKLAGEERHWAISVFQENEEHPITIESQDGSRRFYWKANRDFSGLTENKRVQKGGGPEIRLVQKLTDFSLDWVKDLTFEWDEDLDATFVDPFQGSEDQVTYDEYINSSGIAGDNNYQFVERSGASYLGGAQPLGRDQPKWFPDYAVSRKNWTPEQRQEVRAILIHWISCIMFHDVIHPHQSMISGHPNFIIETLYAGMYCSIFPNHPDAPRWKEEYLEMWDEYLNIYIRKADADNFALAGRHTECITTYSRASLRGALTNIVGFRQYDGTDLTAYPVFKDWIRWHIYALVTAAPWGPEDSHTYTPPQGAHAREVPSPDHSEWHDMFFHYVDAIRPGDPVLADNFLWALTRGREGTKPNLESALFSDYGAILRYDFGGPDEAYLNIQQINSFSGTWENYRLWGGMNYRWGDRGNGIVYYAAHDTIWSWNGVEDNGDNFDINKLPVFKVDNQGLLQHETDGVLYNFNEVQFYRANGSSYNYLSRDVMMIRNDYVAIYDNVRDDVPGDFLWANPYGKLPVIHAVKNNSGDNLHVVEAHSNDHFEVGPNSFPVILKNDSITEYVFMSDHRRKFNNTDTIASGTLSFEGRTAYAQENELAIFEGTSLALKDRAIILSGGDFGLSARFLNDSTIKGRISGRSGGTVKIISPSSFDPADKEIQIIKESGITRKIPTVSGDTIAFDVDISMEDGYYTKFSIVPVGTIPDSKPRHPKLSAGRLVKTDEITVQLSRPVKDTVLFNPDPVRLEALVERDTNTIIKVEFYINGELAGTDTDSSYYFDWNPRGYGEFEVWARAITNENRYNDSEKILVILSDGSPKIEIIHPQNGLTCFAIDTVALSCQATDYDGTIDSVSFFANLQYLGTAYTEPYTFNWINPDAGKLQLTAKAYDDSGNVSISRPVNITVTGFMDPENIEPVTNGLLYEYFEGNWTEIPEFSEWYYIKKDTVSNFTIQDKPTEDGFAFHFTGYIKIRQKGKYVFFTRSDDGSKLYIGDSLIVDNDGIHTTTEKSGMALLDSGLYKIDVAFFDGNGTDRLTVEYLGPGMEKQVIPDSLLFRSVGAPPVIALTSPSPDAMINEGDNVLLEASVSDENNDVQFVEFFDSGKFIARNASSSYVLSIDTFSTGIHTLTAKAYDLGGFTSISEPVTVSINGKPRVSINSPEDLSQYRTIDTITVDLDIEDENIREVRFFLNEKLIATLQDEPWTTDLKKLDIGTYFIKIIAVDANDLSSTVKSRFEVLNTAPAISIVRPENGAVFPQDEEILFLASVYDPDDDVYKVAFYSDGEQLGANANIFHETRVTDLDLGVYTVVAKAFDKAGATSESDSVRINIVPAVSVPENETQNEIRIYPNPLENGPLVVDVSEFVHASGPVMINISDISGRVVYTNLIKDEDTTIHLHRDLFSQKGLYIIRMKAEKNIRMKKLVVM